MTATFSSEQNFASLTFWDSEQFLNYTANETTTALNASFTNTFPVSQIPANYSDPTITTRLWWDNGTAAGIAIINIPIAVNATFQSLSPFGEMKENTNATFGFTYYNNQNQSIPNAQVNVKGWISNNWSVQYINNIYEVNLFAYNLTPGYRNLTISVNSSTYIYQSLPFTVYILVNTTISLTSDNPATIRYITAGNPSNSFYFGQTLYLNIALYSENGTQVSYGQRFSDVTYTMTLDGFPFNNTYKTIQFNIMIYLQPQMSLYL